MARIETIVGVVPLWAVLAAAATAGAVLTGLLTPLAGRLAWRVGAVDPVGGRRIHDRPTPRLGGLALFAALLVLSPALIACAPALFEGLRTEYFAILGGAALIVAAGVADDIRGMRPVFKLLVQLAAAGVVFFGGVRVDYLTWPFAEGGRIALGLWGLPITLVWFAGLMNAINMVDGLDGLCSGICAISGVVLASIIVQFDTSFYAVLPAVTAGLCLGFLLHNYHPARIFLGDTGSLLLGYLIACSSLTTGTKSTAVLTLIIPVLCIAVPVMDTFVAIVRRTRKGRHPFSADKEHLHHRLLGLGLSQRRVVWILWFLTAYLGLTAFTLEKTRSPVLIMANAAFLFAGFLLLIENVSFLAVRREAEQDEIRAARESGRSGSGDALASSTSP